MNKLQITGQITTTINGGTQSQPLGVSLSISSSLGISTGQLIPTGSWVALNTGSIKNMRVGVFTNNDLTSSIYINPGNNTQSGSLLYPDDSIILTNVTQSLLYAKATGSNGNAILNYVLSDY